MAIPPFLPTPSPALARQLGLAGYQDFAHEFEDKDALWARAASDPTSISADERRTILRQPSADRAAANVAQTSGGLTPAQLVTKAATEPASLSLEECNLIQNDFHILTLQRSLDRSQAKSKLGDVRWNAHFRAQNAVSTTEEKVALNNALRIVRARYVELEEKMAQEQKLLERRLLSPPDWIRGLAGGEWGFAIYRCQECAAGNKGFWEWMKYMGSRPAKMGSGLNSVVGGKEAVAKIQLQFVDMIASENDALDFRQNFRSLRDMGLCKAGTLRNTFLLVTPESMDSAAIRSQSPRIPDWVWAFDPDWKSQSRDRDDDGYEGKLKVSWSDLYSWFYMVRSEDRLAFKDLWRKAEQLGGVWKVSKSWAKVRDIPDTEFAAK